MSEEYSLKTESSVTSWPLIYEKGGAFYKLTKREYLPSMNIERTFSTDDPQVMDILKDMKANNWSENCFDAILIILGDVAIFTRDKNLTTCQSAGVFEIFYSCFRFMRLLPALEKDRFLQYFRETLVLYCVQDPPDALRVFNGIQAFEIAKLFHTLIERNFEMMKYVLGTEYVVEYDRVKDP